MITEKIKKLKGSVLGFGLSKNLMKEIKKNKNIVKCDLIDSDVLGDAEETKRIKKFHIKNLRSKFKKKRINYIICNYESILKYQDKFVKDSIYLTNDTVIIYNLNKEQKALLNKKYNRYKTNINIIENKNKYIMEIDTSKAKNNKVKELYYSVIDFIIKIDSIITELLVN